MISHNAIENSRHCKIKRTADEIYNIMVNSSKLKGKNDHLERISFKDWVFINESMSPGYKYLHYLYCRLLTDRHIHYYWLFNNQFKVKLEERGDINIIQHIDNFVELSLLLDQCMAWKSIL